MPLYDSVTLLFPGQGSQYVGMGKSLEGHASYELLNRVNTALDFPLSKIMLEGPEEELALTHNTQPAIVTYSIALLEKAKNILQKKDVAIEKVLGHSVGEYSALVAAGALSFEDAVHVVRARGQFMQDAVPVGKGKMVAIMKVPQEVVQKACTHGSESIEKVIPANFNEPNQIVISGHAAACDRAVAWLNDNHSCPFRAIELKVSAPFHSLLMEPAAEKLKDTLSDVNFNETNIPYIANIDAEVYGAGTTPDVIRDNLYRQVAGSVLWTQSIEQLPAKTLCLEVGPGRVLMGLARKINGDIKVHSLDKEDAFEELEEML